MNGGLIAFKFGGNVVLTKKKNMPTVQLKC